MISQAIRYLAVNSITYTDMIEPIRRGTAEVLSANENGVLMLETNSGIYMIAADTSEDGVRLLSLVKNPELMSIHRRGTANEAMRRYGMAVTMECYTAVWTDQLPPAAPFSAFDICELKAEHVQFVTDLYKHPNIGSWYIEGRIAAGEMFGAFSGNDMVGFIGLHEEGSMGMLEVAGKFRRQGVATCLISYLCAWLMMRGRTPFSQFTTDNSPSRSLHEHMGFEISIDPVYWLEKR